MKLWLNGELLDENAARIAPTDRGFTLGDGLYETVRVRLRRPLRLSAHLARLHAGADALGIPIPHDDRRIEAAMDALLGANDQDDGVFRLTLTRGPAPRGLLAPAIVHPTLLIALAPPAPALPPARAIIATVTRRNELSPTSRFKTLNVLDSLLARREAEARGADDALLLNSRDRLAEATVANLFLVIAGKAVTPPIEEGALPGVARAEIIDQLGASTIPLEPADLARASEAFLTNANTIRALVAVEGKAIGDGTEGPVTAEIRRYWDKKFQ